MYTVIYGLLWSKSIQKCFHLCHSLSYCRFEYSEWNCSLLTINQGNIIVLIQVKCDGSIKCAHWSNGAESHLPGRFLDYYVYTCTFPQYVILLYIWNRNEYTSCIKYNFIKQFSFHWHYYQYRNKIPLKQENTAMLYQLGDFYNSKTLHVQPQNMMPGKNIFSYNLFHIVFNFCILPIIKRHLKKLIYSQYLTNVQKT